MNTFKLDEVVVVTAEKPSGCDDLNTCGDIGMIVDVCTDDKEPYYQVHTGNSAFNYSADELRPATADDMKKMIKKYISSCRKY